MRFLIIVLSLCLGAASAARAQLGIAFSLPGVSIGISVPLYPELVRVPGYPVYYAPSLASNYFFYDGLYWVYQGDNWYASEWYDGPWGEVEPQSVPLFVLRLPVRYYRAPPVYFRGWQRDAPPRWGEHWGPAWQQQRPGWDRWDRHAVPAPAPLPAYQRQYPGRKYPLAQEQQQIRDRNYRHPPRDEAERQPRPAVPPQPEARDRREAPQRAEPARSQPNRPDQGRDKPHKAEQGKDGDGKDRDDERRRERKN